MCVINTFVYSDVEKTTDDDSSEWAVNFKKVPTQVKVAVTFISKKKV